MATGVLTYITQILQTGKNLIFSDQANRLPAAVEATLPAAIGRNQKNGVAATNADGLPVDTQGRPMAVIGNVAGTAADARAVADALAGVNESVTTIGQAVAGKVAAGDVVRSTFMAATPTNANLIAAGETASPSDPLIVYTLGQ